MTTAVRSQCTRAHARAHAICNMAAQAVWIINLIKITNFCVSVLLLFIFSYRNDKYERSTVAADIYNIWDVVGLQSHRLIGF